MILRSFISLSLLFISPFAHQFYTFIILFNSWS